MLIYVEIGNIKMYLLKMYMNNLISFWKIIFYIFKLFYLNCNIYLKISLIKYKFNLSILFRCEISGKCVFW